MKQVTTYVGIDAHKKDLFIAMLMGNEGAPVTLDGCRMSRRPSVAWCGSLSARRLARSTCSMKPGRVATPCNGR